MNSASEDSGTSAETQRPSPSTWGVTLTMRISFWHLWPSPRGSSRRSGDGAAPRATEPLELQPGTLRLRMGEGARSLWLAEILGPHVARLVASGAPP